LDIGSGCFLSIGNDSAYSFLCSTFVTWERKTGVQCICMARYTRSRRDRKGVTGGYNPIGWCDCGWNDQFVALNTANIFLAMDIFQISAHAIFVAVDAQLIWICK
jgi:hypothetical protein